MDVLPGTAQHERNISFRVAENLPLVKQPLDSRAAQAHEVEVRHGPVEPKIDGNDGCGTKCGHRREERQKIGWQQPAKVKTRNSAQNRTRLDHLTISHAHALADKPGSGVWRPGLAIRPAS